MKKHKDKPALDKAVDAYVEARKRYNHKLWFSRCMWAEIRRADPVDQYKVACALRTDKELEEAEKAVLYTRIEMCKIVRNIDVSEEEAKFQKCFAKNGVDKIASRRYL